MKDQPQASPHFSDDEWVDFVRGVATPEALGEMRQHLEQECPECGESHRLWQCLVSFGRREAEAPVPPVSASVPVALLIFDSFQQAAPAGMREAVPSARHLIYDAFPFLVDL